MFKMNQVLSVDRFMCQLFSSSLHPLITKPTRIMDRSATLIDNILTNSLDDSNLRGILITDILACEQALLGVGGGRGKEERACNEFSSGIFISASMQNADWWILNLVLTSLLFACVVLTIQKWWKAEFLFVKVARISRNNLGFLWN